MEEKRNVKKRILITVVILFLIQLLAGIPTPGVNLNYFKSLLEQNTTAGLRICTGQTLWEHLCLFAFDR